MTGRPLVTRPTKLTMSLPEDIRARLDLYLFSEVEGCIPKGAYQKLFVQLIREFLDKRSPNDRAESN